MLKNAPFLITIGVDTAENEPRKGWYVVARTVTSVYSEPAAVDAAAQGSSEVFRVPVELGHEHCREAVWSRIIKILSKFYQNFSQILAKLAPPIAREGAFFRVFRDLHDFRIFPENY